MFTTKTLLTALTAAALLFGAPGATAQSTLQVDAQLAKSNKKGTKLQPLSMKKGLFDVEARLFIDKHGEVPYIDMAGQPWQETLLVVCGEPPGAFGAEHDPLEGSYVLPFGVSGSMSLILGADNPLPTSLSSDMVYLRTQVTPRHTKTGLKLSSYAEGPIQAFVSPAGQSKGDKGDPGVDGAKGDPGADGAKGAKGDPGADGAKGDPGADGAKGDKGDPGADGAKGDKGDPGADGAKGDTGADGAKGAPGADGAKGDKGDKGFPGATGSKGPKGDKGDAGASPFIESPIGTAKYAGNKLVIEHVGDATLSVKADTNNSGEWDHAVLELEQDGGLTSALLGYEDSSNDLRLKTVSNNKLMLGTNDKIRATLDLDGDLGLGTTPGANVIAALHVLEDDGGGHMGGSAIVAQNVSKAQGIGIWSETNGTDANLVLDQSGTGTIIKAFSQNKGVVFEVRNSGRVVTTALQITGGGDLVEGFETSEELCEPGTVVSIDPANPGQLTASTEAYDRKVAGIVSGANGVNHGIRMGQDDVLDGDTLLAMAGRVWTKASAENGAIEPGDLLTTSSIEGHAMRSSDRDRGHGSVIGKAMSPLASGTGLVLVLVDLQ
jgi:hypothetical protein